MNDTAIRWTRAKVDTVAWAVLGDIWFGDAGNGEQLTVARVFDPIERRWMWSLDNTDSVELGRFETVEDAMAAAEKL